mmetsp:Transcript_1535/g.5421  ORF Transcript_1535/g.5421 Transcript_1535/m.5421 type:complete len:380 (-) Transcript_1535:32-1171(-)
MGDATPVEDLKVPSFIKGKFKPALRQKWGELLEKVREGNVAVTNDTALAFLKQYNWDVERAFVAIKEDIHWRKMLKVDELGIQHIRGQVKTGKFVFTGGKDKEGRAVMIFNAARHFIGGDLLETLQLALYAIEMAIKSMEGTDQYEILLIEDLTGFKKSENSDMKMIKFLADAAQAHYPCRIGMFYAVNSPWYYNVLYTIVKPWLSDDLASIVNIVSDCKPLRSCIEPDQLPAYLGGTLEVDVDEWVAQKLDEAKDLEDNRVIPIETQVMLGCHVSYKELLADAEKHGPLKKQGGYVKKYNKRFGILWHGLLLYFRDPKDNVIEGFLDLCTASVTPKGKHGFIVKTFEKEGFFQCSDGKERDEWVAALQSTTAGVSRDE